MNNKFNIYIQTNKKFNHIIKFNKICKIYKNNMMRVKINKLYNKIKIY